jgi:hypothetical protein
VCYIIYIVRWLHSILDKLSLAVGTFSDGIDAAAIEIWLDSGDGSNL